MLGSARSTRPRREVAGTASDRTYKAAVSCGARAPSRAVRGPWKGAQPASEPAGISTPSSSASAIMSGSTPSMSWITPQ